MFQGRPKLSRRRCWWELRRHSGNPQERVQWMDETVRKGQAGNEGVGVGQSEVSSPWSPGQIKSWDLECLKACWDRCSETISSKGQSFCSVSRWYPAEKLLNTPEDISSSRLKNLKSDWVSWYQTVQKGSEVCGCLGKSPNFVLLTLFLLLVPNI